MKTLFLRAEFGPLWEPWEEDEIGRKHMFLNMYGTNSLNANGEKRISIVKEL